MGRCCLLSIIIPVYNASKTINKCLDSIYQQGIDEKLFEVLCIDDNSSDDSSSLIDAYLFNEYKPVNLQLIRHLRNRKRGGACNTGVMNSSGKWIIYLDSDDYLLKDGLKKLFSIFRIKDSIDVLIYNYSNSKDLCCLKNISPKAMNGELFLQTQPIPWTTWCYAFKRDLLERASIKYEENVFFEDCDYVIRVLLSAKIVQFVDCSVLFYSVYEGQTSTINSKQKVEDLFNLMLRLKNIGLSLLDDNYQTAQAVLNHHWFQYFSILKRYLWRLPSRDIYELLVSYKPYDDRRWYHSFIYRYPFIYICIAQIAKIMYFMKSATLERLK